ncbi:hypothetical protein PoB_003482000 [Plakobranchus ocellatus]|uniref:Uncharacterized protein n=1 Tax=Plakobranchus ocellatus TaxID=259542 RepID=A0AAV4ALS8_9GAST|nr:hypothetical protein PoB_003482000 [Plakobranchus ocellatus]
MFHHFTFRVSTPAILDRGWLIGSQQDDLRLLGLLSGQGISDGIRTRDKRISADLKADSLSTAPPEKL